MAHSNTVSLAIAMANLASFMLAAGLLSLGFRGPSISCLWARMGHLLFVVGTLTATVNATLHGTTPNMLAASIAWVTIISWFVWQIELIAAFTSPLIAIILMSGIFFAPNSYPYVTSEQGLAMKLHVSSAVLGQTFAIIACAMSLLFLWLDKKLKNKQLQDVPVKFPGINTLNKSLTVALWAGFIFITISLLSGSFYAISGQLPLSINLSSKVIWAILVWVWYLAILILKSLLGFRPQKVARMSLVGFFILALSWFGLVFWLPWGQS
jgi:ABC-type uncharacterized transport system permease subunit